jgi:hypothetical protein
VATETTKITRMQQRRGLKQDLPKPLRPGEIGFATDSRQIYIGADTVDAISDIYNKTGVFEKTSSAQSITTSVGNVQIIKFTVPHKVYDKGDFDGVTDSASWTPDTDVASSYQSTEYSRLGKVFKPQDTEFKNIFTNTTFAATDLKVVQEGKLLEPSPVATISSGDDYFFAQTGNLSLGNHTHQLTLRTPPSGADALSISYYGNTQVISSIEDNKIGTTNQDGFYNAMNITNYRQLDNNNIRVTPGTGIGYIGLQFKHIQVATDVKHTPTDAAVSGAGDVGFLYLTKTSTTYADANVAADASQNPTQVYLSNLTTPDEYNVSGIYNHVYVTGGNDWLDNQILKVNTYDSSAGTMIADLPSNSARIAQSISAISNVSNNVQITIGTTEDIEVGDDIYFWENSTNASGLHQTSATITNISGNTIDLAIAFSSVANSQLSNVSAITYKDGVSSNVVVVSDRHGVPNANTVSLTGGGGALNGTQSFTAEVTGNTNTFIVNFGTSMTSNIVDLTFTPVVSSTTLSTTPVFSGDLQNAETLESAKAIVNNAGGWPRLNNIPGESTKLYITHAESVQKTPFDFALHNDQKDTVTKLGLVSDTYRKYDSTVKAKLEEWMYAVQSDVNLNLFKEVYVNNEFQQFGSFVTWQLGIDSALGEMNFESRDEAKDFSQILNNLYFESVNPDIRGLLNIKTNIEFLTAEALAAGTATTSFTSPEQVTLLNGNNVISELGLALTQDFQTLMIEYSIVGGTISNRYRRVGRLMYSGDDLTDEIAINDNFTDVSTGFSSGDVTFSGTVAGSQATILCNNTLSPSTQLTMRYVVRRWGD